MTESRTAQNRKHTAEEYRITKKYRTTEECQTAEGRQTAEGSETTAESKREGARTLVEHTFPPVFDSESRVLILGSIPSPKSRELGFYYGHPRNRFWKVLSSVLSEPEFFTGDTERKKALLHAHHIALWDVLASCYIRGADDGSILEPRANDIASLVQGSRIQYIFTTGTKAYALYRKYCEQGTGIRAVRLPSTSPANCAVRDEALQNAYTAIADALKEE